MAQTSKGNKSVHVPSYTKAMERKFLLTKEAPHLHRQEKSNRNEENINRSIRQIIKKDGYARINLIAGESNVTECV
jgi:hypothetical protein